MNDEIKKLMLYLIATIQDIDDVSLQISSKDCKILYDYITDLQSNWNSLREYLKIRLNQSINGIRDDEIRKALDKMNELEGEDNEK